MREGGKERGRMGGFGISGTRKRRWKASLLLLPLLLLPLLFSGHRLALSKRCICSTGTDDHLC